MTIPNIAQAAKQKGLHVIGTGDITQPDWLNHIRVNTKTIDESISHDDVYFILTTEFEDADAIHHLIIIPNFESVEQLRKSLKQHSPNIDAKWGGRPRINLKGEELAGLVRDTNGLIGPAHAFTPFRSIFRESKYESLSECYGSETAHIHFMELGLSADTEIADAIPELNRLTFITSSDAHSPAPDKLGREFVRFKMESPTFDELRKGLLRQSGRMPILNVGFNPRLGKYYLSFCSKCRRTLVIREGSDAPHFDDVNLHLYCNNQEEQNRLLDAIHNRRVPCPADGKPIRLGVRDRANMIGKGRGKSPPHRPPYLDIPPLLELLTTALEVKSTSSKKVRLAYDQMRNTFGSEIEILTNTPTKALGGINEKIMAMISAYRDKTVSYIAGGGGRYGKLVAPWLEV
ncbi:MAG: endonuclease Q family protein [Candidatus Thorarchaeota archaeon]|jgi:PHP family Zn ribbon phosphoesterase